MKLNKIYHSKEHRERSQPSNRKKLGFLEKKKDYLIRAKNFHQKQKTLNTLKKKARNKNEDEFYFGMIKSRTKNGVHILQEEQKNLNKDQLKLAETQDLSYVRFRKQHDLKRLEKLFPNVLPAENESAKKHVIFENEESFSSTDSVKDAMTTSSLKPNMKIVKEIEARKKRLAKLEEVESYLQLQRNLVSKDSRRVVHSSGSSSDLASKPSISWLKERKK